MMTLTVGLASTFGFNFGVIIPALAKDVLGTDATGYGFLMAATGIGSLVAALGIAFSGRSRPILAPVGAAILGLALVATSLVHVFPVALVTMLFVGFGAIAMAATANTTIQLAVPDELRGRVISVYTTVFVGSTPLGGLLMGWIASAWSVDAAIAVGGLGAFAAGVLALVWLARIQARRGRPLTETSTMRPRDAAVPASATSAGATTGSARPR
jgi:MFS family permease